MLKQNKINPDDFREFNDLEPLEQQQCLDAINSLTCFNVQF